VIELDQYLPAIAAGDSQVFGLWMASAEPILRDSLRRFASQIDAEAVLQEALLRIWQVAPRFEPDGKPNGLLRFGFRVTRNLAISELRRQKKQSPVDPGQIAETLESEVKPPDPLLRRVIERCRELLPKKPAQAIEARLHSAGRLPDETLAQQLGMRTNTFLQNITRARKLLVDCLQKNGVELFQGERV